MVNDIKSLTSDSRRQGWNMASPHLGIDHLLISNFPDAISYNRQPYCDVEEGYHNIVAMPSGFREWTCYHAGSVRSNLNSQIASGKVTEYFMKFRS